MTTETPGRGWTRCEGCKRLRSTTDEQGVCDGCRPLVAKGMVRLGRPTPKPRAATDAADAAEPGLDAGGSVAPPGVIAADDVPGADPGDDLPPTPEPKRRWWKRRQ